MSTPPMDEDTADGKPRGFFSSLMPPLSADKDIESLDASTAPSNAAPKYNAHRMSVAVPSREWWEQQPSKPPRREDASLIAKFEFDIPEHLPTSPMCPANVKHKSVGTGMCVYHGRRKVYLAARDKGTKGQDLTGRKEFL